VIRLPDDDVLLAAVILAFAVAAAAFILFVQSGGFLDVAIDRAIDEGRVIAGMTRAEVISSWGRPVNTEEHSIQLMDVDELVALTWTYETPHRCVHFSSAGVVLWVVSD